jgi:hypothetical protein
MIFSILFDLAFLLGRFSKLSRWTDFYSFLRISVLS